MDPRRGLDIFEEGKILLSLLGFEHHWSSTKPSHYTDHAITTRQILGGKRKMRAIILPQFLTLCIKYFFQISSASVATTANCNTAVRLS